MQKRDPLAIYFFFKEDGKYDTLSTNSLLLPNGFEYEDAEPKEMYRLKPGINARLLAKSTDEADIKRYQILLEKRLQLNRTLNVTEESLNFFNSVDEDDDERQVATEPAPDENSTDIGSAPTLSQQSENDSCSNAAILRQLQSNEKCLKLSLKVQEKIYQELKLCRKHLTKGDRSLLLPPSANDMKEVHFEGQNVTILGDKNMDMSSYGVTLARRLFSDDEIQSAMLFPTRSTARPSLSPTRSQIFREAVTARFGDDDIKEAVVAVNCLGNDLKRGKRKRKSYQ